MGTLQDFRLVFFTDLAIFAPSLILYLLIQEMPSLVDIFAASRSTLWGVFTSLFVHAEFWHITLNMVTLLAYSILFILVNLHLPAPTRKYRSRIFAYVTFLSAVAANAIWVALVPAGTFGASSAVYAVAGLWIGYAVKNTLEPLRGIPLWQGLKFSPIRAALIHNKKVDKHYAFNFLVCLAYIPYIVFVPGAFLGVAPGVNSPVHGIAFLISLFATQILGR